MRYNVEGGGLLEVDVGEEEQQEEGGEEEPALDHLWRQRSESWDLKCNTVSTNQYLQILVTSVCFKIPGQPGWVGLQQRATQ